MNGGGKKKKSKRAPAAAEAAGQGGGGGSERKKPGEEGVSVRAACARQLLLVTRAAQVACSAPKPPLPSPLRVPGGRDQPDASRAGHGTASIAERLAAPRLCAHLAAGNGGPWAPWLPARACPKVSRARYRSLSFCYCRRVVCTVLKSLWFISYQIVANAQDSQYPEASYCRSPTQRAEVTRSALGVRVR